MDKCGNCGCRIKSSDEVCPDCGKELYESVFGDISDELENELCTVSEDDLKRIRREYSGYTGKMSYEEFKEFYGTNIQKPPPWFMFKARIRYENISLPKAYESYLKSSGE